jgi:von Willebrand factor type A domain
LRREQFARSRKSQERRARRIGAAFAVPGPSRTVGLLVMMAATAAAVGCAGTTALEVKKVRAVIEPPANVALHLKIKRPDGKAVTLLATDFKVYEDGKQIPSKKLKRALLPASVVVDRYVMVAVDLSGPLVDSEYLSTLQDVVASFSERAGKDTHFALSVFDGDGLKPFVRFEDTEIKPGLAGMRRFRPHNRTVDVWGAFMAALDALDEAAKGSTALEHTSALVFMTDRRDKAGKHTLDEANTRLQASKADVFVIGIGDAIDREELQRLGRPDAFFAEKFRDLGKPFDQAAEELEAERGQDYVFSYCSVARPGKKPTRHKLELQIETKKWSGEVEHEFSSRTFEKGVCDPRQKIEFAPKSEAKRGGEGEDG